MKVGLFVPCYIDVFHPRVGLAAVDLLERRGVTVDFPADQTCCGQPMANAGCETDAVPLARRFIDIFAPYEYVVCPSASCVAMVRNHFPRLLGEETPICRRTYELCEFLTGVLDVESVEGRFAHRVGLHQSCHGLRELRLGTASERMVAGKDPARQLLRSLKDIELVELERPDECCGFGGTFSVDEEAVSCLMGRDRIADHRRAGAEIITSMDMSCLMHLQGLIRQQGDGPRVMHIAEILAAGEAAGT